MLLKKQEANRLKNNTIKQLWKIHIESKVVIKHHWAQNNVMNNESLLKRITHNPEEVNAATELTYIEWKKMKKYHNLIKKQQMIEICFTAPYSWFC
jgi:hypothetical protein